MRGPRFPSMLVLVALLLFWTFFIKLVGFVTSLVISGVVIVAMYYFMTRDGVKNV